MASLKDSILLQRLRGERTEVVPVWFMRQAGRYLPEYRELRKKHSMLDAIRTPELAAEITLQPLKRFDLDAAIIFADILTPLIGMGIELDFIAGEGPKIFNPIAAASDIARLVVPAPEENVGYTLEAIRAVSRVLESKGKPVFGFSGAPFTLASYMIKDADAPVLAGLKRFILSNHSAWVELQEKLGVMVAEYLIAQIDAGASAVQLFDSWVGALGPDEFAGWVAPTLQKIVRTVKQKTSAPLIYFSTGTTGLLPQIAELGFDVISIDWRVSLKTAANLTGGKIPLQGNLDPVLLSAPFPQLRLELERILQEGAALGAHIFNVGHGLLPETDPAQVERVIDVVHGYRS